MVDDDDARALRLLTESLTNLAADPATQLAFLGSWPTDELAEDHFAPAGNAWWMCDEGLISPRVRELAERIGAVFDSMSGQENAQRWSQGALGGDPGWIEIRAIAREALGLIVSCGRNLDTDTSAPTADGYPSPNQQVDARGKP